jgi:hypothetical protein
MKVWVTKYALSKGILEKDVRETNAPGMVAVNNTQYGEFYHVEGRDWHRTRAAAETKAEEMRKAKIASLVKQVLKLEKMRFGE